MGKTIISLHGIDYSFSFNDLFAIARRLSDIEVIYFYSKKIIKTIIVIIHEVFKKLLHDFQLCSLPQHIENQIFRIIDYLNENLGKFPKEIFNHLNCLVKTENSRNVSTILINLKKIFIDDILIIDFPPDWILFPEFDDIFKFI